MNSINRNPKPISRKPSAFRSPGLGITPTTNTAGRFTSKNDLLARFQDNEDNNEQEDIFGGNEFDSLPIEDEFRTLKISPNELETLRLKTNHVTKDSNGISNRIQQFQEEDSDELGFEDEEFANDNLQLNYRTTLNEPDDEELKLSPGTISTSSPKPRMRSKSLSEYSEDTNDTDVTSQFNDDDFDDINDVDNIFGNEESGIYSSGGNGNTSKANRHLLLKQQKMQNDAEIEERELFKKYKRLAANDETNTLKLKDFTFYDHNPIETDALENEKTVDYEYTKDDFENFEDGFDTDVPIRLDVDKLKQYARGGNSISMKSSMPNFNNKNNLSKAKKYKSTMDLVNEFETQHPVFNNNNKIIRKLDRIPSFYNKNNTIKPSKSKLNHDIEMEKQKLLNKYMEITEKQNRLNNRHRKKNLSMKHPNRKNKRIGLVRYLNDNPIPQPNNNSQMKYNPVNKKWEGNDIELVKFENLNVPKPLLISFNEFKNNMKDKKIQGNMVYDPDQLKWINLNKDEDNVFQGLPDLPDLQINKRSVSNSPTKNMGRGVSTFTQRTGSTMSTTSNSPNSNEFEIPPKLIEKFHKEETKLLKKINYWFQQQNYDLTNSHFNHNYFWEIRKMVIDNED